MSLSIMQEPDGEDDYFLRRQLQVVVVPHSKLTSGATVEDFIFGLIPGVVSRAVILPFALAYQEHYLFAFDRVCKRVSAEPGARILSKDEKQLRIEYETKTLTGERLRETLSVRLLHVDLSYAQVAAMAADALEAPALDFRKVREDVVRIISEDSELFTVARKALLTKARNPSYPVSLLSLEYAQTKKKQALQLLAEAHGFVCARVAYSACRAVSDPPSLPPWEALDALARNHALEATHTVILGDATSFRHGYIFGPLFVHTVQQALRHCASEAPEYERERQALFATLKN